MIFHYDCHQILIINDQDNVSHVHIFEIEIYKYLSTSTYLRNNFNIYQICFKWIITNWISMIKFIIICNSCSDKFFPIPSEIQTFFLIIYTEYLKTSKRRLSRNSNTKNSFLSIRNFPENSISKKITKFPKTAYVFIFRPI